MNNQLSSQLAAIQEQAKRFEEELADTDQLAAATSNRFRSACVAPARR